MKKWKCILLLAAAINFSAYMLIGESLQAAENQVGSNKEIVEKIRGLQKAISSFSGNFSMQTFVNDPDNPELAEGRIIFKAPSFWRIEQHDPGSRIPYYKAGCNGKAIWYVDERDDDGGSLIKSDVANIPPGQQNALIQTTIGLTPLCIFSEGFVGKISSIANGQDNTWIFKIVPAEAYKSRAPADIHIDEIRWEVSKETGLLKAWEWSYEGKKIRSIQFKNIKLEPALTTPRSSPQN